MGIPEIVDPALAIRPLAVERANQEPLPGPTAEAFIDPEIKVGKFVVRPITDYDIRLSKKFNLPIYKLIMQAKDAPQSEEESKLDVDFESEEIWETCFQFTRPMQEVRQWEKKGREAFTDAAVSEIGGQCDPFIVSELLNAVFEQFKRCMSTRLQYKASKPDSEGAATESFFRDTQANLKTG